MISGLVSNSISACPHMLLIYSSLCLTKCDYHSEQEGKIGLLESKQVLSWFPIMFKPYSCDLLYVTVFSLYIEQEMTNTGIYYLCQVAGGIKDGFNTKFFQVRALICLFFHYIYCARL